MRRILVLRGGALGDLIVTLPALALLRRRWPEARIELAGNPTAAQLARNRGVVDAVHSQHEARWAALFGDDSLPAAFARWLTEFDLVLSYWPDPDGALARRFPLRAGQAFRTAPALPARSPAAAHYCEPLRDLGLETGNYFFPLTPLAAAVPPIPRGTIAIHPGSGSPRKNWPANHWRDLLAWMPPPASVVLGEAEAERWQAGNLPAKATAWCNLPLESLVAHLASCRLFVGHDSGISHLAAACGAKCLLLFGPTNPMLWAPPTAAVQVLRRGPEVAAISVDDVQQAVTRAIADQS